MKGSRDLLGQILGVPGILFLLLPTFDLGMASLLTKIATGNLAPPENLWKEAEICKKAALKLLCTITQP